MYKPVVVLDTNIYVSSLFWRGKPYRVVEKALNNEITVFISGKIIDELKRALKRDFGLDRLHITNAVDVIMNFANLIEPKERVDIIKEDPADNSVLECAAASKAEFIITRDNHLLKLKGYNNTRVILPEQFLKLI